MNKLLFLAAMAVVSLPVKAAKNVEPTFTEWHDLQVNSIKKPWQAIEQRQPTSFHSMATGNSDGWQMPMNGQQTFTQQPSTIHNGERCPYRVYGNSTVSAILFTSMWVLRGADILKTIRRMYRSKIITWALTAAGCRCPKRGKGAKSLHISVQ